MDANAFTVGIDVGGTFTDVVAIDARGHVTLAKAASTPTDQSVGVIDGLTRLAEQLDLDLTTLLRRVSRIVHGTTVATNALLERKGAKVGLLTTEGHRDVLNDRVRSCLLPLSWSQMQPAKREMSFMTRTT